MPAASLWAILNCAALHFALARESLAHKMEALMYFTGGGYESSPNSPALRGPHPPPVCRAVTMPGAELSSRVTSIPWVGTWSDAS